LKNRLKILRAENDWSQARLAEELGVSRQTVNAIETGKYDPSLPLAFDLARVFRVRIEEIFTPEPGAPKKERQPAPAEAPSQLPFPELDVSLM
jgi:putative transcriptional regulator